MKYAQIAAFAALFVSAPFSAAAAEKDEIAQIRAHLEQIKTLYEQRIATLEERLARAEKRAEEVAESLSDRFAVVIPPNIARSVQSGNLPDSERQLYPAVEKSRRAALSGAYALRRREIARDAQFQPR